MVLKNNSPVVNMQGLHVVMVVGTWCEFHQLNGYRGRVNKNVSASKHIKVVQPKEEARKKTVEEEKKAGSHAKAVCWQRLRLFLQLPGCKFETFGCMTAQHT